MRSILFPCLLLFGAVSAHAQSTTTFQLPPDPERTERPQAQGPTDVEGETRSTPRVIGTPTPTPTIRATPTAQPSPRATSTPRPGPTAQPTRSATTGPALPATDRPVSTREVLSPQRAQAAQSDSAGAQQPSPDAPGDSPGDADGAAQADTTLPDLTGTAPPATAEPTQESTQEVALEPAFGFDWRWIAALLGALIAIGAVWFVLTRRRKRADAPSAEVVNLAGPPLREVTDQAEAPLANAGSLELEAFAVTLSRSVMNATISYRVSMLNRGRQAISQIRISGDVTSAHGRVPAEQQLADTQQAFPELHLHERLEPGERATVRGELRLPLREIRALRQGNVPVFVPLLRLIVRADNMEPRAHTYVIGAKPVEKGARPNPFRLDEPPRSYGQLTTRAVA